MRFENKRVLVTGSSRNTGVGIAKQFAAEGATVVVNGTQPDNVANAAKEIREAGGKVVEVVADLSTLRGVEALFEQIDQELGGIDILVNNAVHLGIGPNFLEVEDELMVAVMTVNVMGYYRCGQAAAKRMVAQGTGGAIVNVSSNTADRPVRHRTAYCASKGAIDSLTRAMAIDLASHRIRVNTVAPGYIWTERWVHLSEADQQRRRANIPLGQPATADDVAAAVLFLASEAAGNVTGARIVVDGGVLSQLTPKSVDG